MKLARRLRSVLERLVRDDNDSRRSERGDTLLEVLFTLLVIGLCGVALITAFTTSISASAEERNLVTVNTVMRSASESIFAMFQQSSSPYDATCVQSKADYPSITPSAPSGYQATIASVEYWQSTSGSSAFGTACTVGSTAPQLITVTVKGPHNSGGSNSFVVQDVNSTPPIAGPVSQLAVISAPVSGSASASTNLGPITIEEEDASGNPTTTAETITLTSTSSRGVFSATPGGAAVTSVAIPSGSSTVAFYYGDTQSGTPLITGTVSGLSSATQRETISPASPQQLVVTSTAISGAASATTNLGPITVQEEDSFGNPTTAAETVALTSSSAGTAEFSTTPAGTAVTSVTIPSGSSAVTIYYGDTKSGTPSITGTSSGLASAIQQETVIPAAAHQLVITTGPVAGLTSATTNLGPITVQERDSFGNLTTSPETVSLTSTSGGGKFSATPGGTTGTSITIATGSSSANFYYGDTNSGTPTVTASAFGLTSATQQETIQAPPTITTPNSSSPYSVAHGGAASFTISGTGFTSGATVTFSGGGFTNEVVTYVSSTTLKVTATAGGASNKGTYNLTVTDPGIPPVTSSNAIKVT